MDNKKAANRCPKSKAACGFPDRVTNHFKESPEARLNTGAQLFFARFFAASSTSAARTTAATLSSTPLT